MIHGYVVNVKGRYLASGVTITGISFTDNIMKAVVFVSPEHAASKVADMVADLRDTRLRGDQSHSERDLPRYERQLARLTAELDNIPQRPANRPLIKKAITAIEKAESNIEYCKQHIASHKRDQALRDRIAADLAKYSIYAIEINKVK
jgi:hypothetical protein